LHDRIAAKVAAIREKQTW